MLCLVAYMHAEVYYQEDGLCAKVICHLCVFGPLKDDDLNNILLISALLFSVSL